MYSSWARLREEGGGVGMEAAVRPTTLQGRWTMSSAIWMMMISSLLWTWMLPSPAAEAAEAAEAEEVLEVEEVLEEAGEEVGRAPGLEEEVANARRNCSGSRRSWSRIWRR